MQSTTDSGADPSPITPMIQIHNNGHSTEATGTQLTITMGYMILLL